MLATPDAQAGTYSFTYSGGQSVGVLVGTYTQPHSGTCGGGTSTSWAIPDASAACSGETAATAIVVETNTASWSGTGIIVPTGKARAIMNGKKKHGFHNLYVAISGILAMFAVTAFVCLQSGWQPSGYQTSPDPCPPGQADTRGYCSVQRSDDFVHIYHRTAHSLIIHISRGSGPGGNDSITIVRFSSGKLTTYSHSFPDPYPPQNLTDAFVQSVRDRRTEFYSEMGWPDPNSRPVIPPNH